jgi:hypothetical protein
MTHNSTSTRTHTYFRTATDKGSTYTYVQTYMHNIHGFKQLWTKDQLARLKEKGICGPTDAKLTRSELAERIALMEGD